MFGWKKKSSTSSDSALPQITALRSQAESLLGDNTPEARQSAYALVIQALESLPEPIDACPQAAAVFQTLGDIYFQSGEVETALNAYVDAIRCKDALGTASLHLRLGKAQYELGALDRAADELCRAYLCHAQDHAGRKIFSGEDPKYFAFLKTRMREPVEGW